MIRRHAPATERNREPIRDVLARVLPPKARVLEVASGTGEHAAYFGRVLDVAAWQPTDHGDAQLASIDAWTTHENAMRVLPASVLDATGDWPTSAFDAVVCINMIHISPWSSTLGLFRGASEVLSRSDAAARVLFLYGPYFRRNVAPEDENARFDARLRSENPAWGVRFLEDVVAVGAEMGFACAEVVAMPARNLSVVFRLA